MPSKIVRFDDETSALIDRLRRERRRSFQHIADEAFRDLLAKHGHPPSLKEPSAESPDRRTTTERPWTPEEVAARMKQITEGDDR